MQLSVLTLNLHNIFDRWLGRRELIINGLLAAEADIILFQEVNIARGQARWLLNQTNARLRGKVYQLTQTYQRHIPFGLFDGLAILSKYPILYREILPLPERRIGLLANIALPTGDTIDMVSVHLSPGPFLPEIRYEQVMQLTGQLSVTGRSALQIIGGDFNDVPDSPAIERMKQRYRSGWETVFGSEPLATFPTGLGDYPTDWTGCLDYIFMTNNLQVETASLFGDRIHDEDPTLFMSDHVGMSVSVTVR